LCYCYLRSILKTSDGNIYRAKVGNCIGSLNNYFQQGTDLLSNDNEDIYVYALEGGMFVSGREESCGNGVTIQTESGEVHTYCNLRENTIPYREGDYIETNAFIGIMGFNNTTYQKSLFFSVQKLGKFVDLSNHFVTLYGGQCQNKNRSNCRLISNNIEYQQCISVLEK